MNNLQKAIEIVHKAEIIDKEIASYRAWNREYEAICAFMKSPKSEHILVQKYDGKTRSFVIENMLLNPVFELQIKLNLKKIKSLQAQKSKLNHKL